VIEFRCRARIKGRPCHKLLFKSEAFIGVIQIMCPRCETVNYVGAEPLTTACLKCDHREKHTFLEAATV